MKKVLPILIYVALSVAFAIVIPGASGQNDLSTALSELLSNPVTFLVFLIQLVLGFGLGYFSMKALKYIIAILCLLTLGVLLNIWQFGGLEGFLEKLGYKVDFLQLIAILNSVASVLGILTILPIGIGFFIGVIFAARK